MKRAVFEVTIDGTNIETALRPLLLGMTITDNAGTHSDTASIEIDDTEGRVILPEPKAPVVIYLGWQDEGVREVFRGTVDEVHSAGGRSGGRTLTISAKGVDTTSKAKEGQHRHFDNKSVKDILSEAGRIAGIAEVDVDPALASIVLPYIDMRGESFIHLGERLARAVGGSFRVTGAKVLMAKRSGDYTASVTAAAGDNLHEWQITPKVGRGRYKGAAARAYDRKTASEIEVSALTDVDLTDADFVRREVFADEDEAQRAADADAATARETAGSGSVTIEGTTDAIPDGLCVLRGARPGVDGTYRIKTVTHSYSRSDGWKTALELAEPQGTAGTDTR